MSLDRKTGPRTDSEVLPRSAEDAPAYADSGEIADELHPNSFGDHPAFGPAGGERSLADESPDAEPVPPRPSPPTAPAPVAQAPPVQGDPLDAELVEFDLLIGSYLDGIVEHEIDSTITVPVVKVDNEHVLVDMGDKAEGVIGIEEFFDSKGYIRIAVGDRVEVQVLGRDEESGLILVSHRKARIQTAWLRLEQALENAVPISGRVSRAVKSGVLVDVGIECFMPASHIADHRVANLEEWVDKDVDVLVLELDRRKNRAVVSRRRLIEENKKKALEEALALLGEGQVVQGTVRSALNFGAFIDLDGVDAFLPREELSWDRGVAPTSLLTPGQPIKVKILQVDHETNRVRVSRRAMRRDPWETAASKYPKDRQVRGEVVSITRYGAFVHIEEGLTGLIHVSDLSWAKSPQRVTDHLKEGDSVRAVVLEVDQENRRMSLGLKQLVEDPWEEAEKIFPRMSRVKGAVTGLASFGAFVRLNENIEGLIHISDFAWEEKIKHPGEKLKVGDEVEALVLKTDKTTRRISLGIKQLSESPAVRFIREHPAGSRVEGEVVRLIPPGAFLSLASGIDGFLPVSQIGLERVEKPEDALKIGERIECKVTKVEKKNGKITLSRKALLTEEESAAIKQFSADPNSKGVMKLGDLLEGIRIGNPGGESDV
jgi:small subunit ribosomal protein S1